MKLTSNKKSMKALKLTVFLFPISLIAIFIFIQVYFGFYEEFFDLLMRESVVAPPPDTNPEFYKQLLLEDGPIENANAITLFIAGIIGFIITSIFIKKGNKKFGILYLLLAIGFIVLGFEEISWGQRIFNLQTPDLFSSNLQNQITVHNLQSVKPYIHDFLMLVGFLGAFSWLIFKRWEGNSHNSFLRIFIPPGYLMFYFLPIFIFYLMGIFMPFNHQIWELGDWLPWNDQEPPELLMSIGILLFTLISFQRQNAQVKKSKLMEK